MKYLAFTVALICGLVVRLPAAPPGSEAPNSSSASPGSRPAKSDTPEPEPRRILHTVEFLVDDGIPGKEYAKQLDYFQIELGAEDAQGQVEYASHLTSPRPERHSGNRQDDPRVTISWKRGGLVALDRKLLAKAGINTKGKKLSLFFPREVEDQMLKLDETYVGELNVPKIARALYKIRLKEPGPGYEFYIADLGLMSDTPTTTSPSASSSRK